MTEVRLYVTLEKKCFRPTPAKAGYVLECTIHGKEVTRVGFVQDESMTPQKGQLMAVVTALKRIRGDCTVTAIGDLDRMKGQVVNLRLWQKNGFKRKNGLPLNQVELWKEYASLADDKDITFIENPGHKYAKWIMKQMEHKLPVKTPGEDKKAAVSEAENAAEKAAVSEAENAAEKAAGKKEKNQEEDDE